MDINYCLLLATGFILFTNQINLDPKYSASVCPNLRSRIWHPSYRGDICLNFSSVVSDHSIFNRGYCPFWNYSDARVTFLTPNMPHTCLSVLGAGPRLQVIGSCAGRAVSLARPGLLVQPMPPGSQSARPLPWEELLGVSSIHSLTSPSFKMTPQMNKNKSETPLFLFI